MRIGSACSGYEGLGMAIHEVLGGELAWVADNDPGASAILAHRFPGVPNLDDITVVDWGAVEPVDLLCAGFPCQDVSAAGKRAGLRTGTRSGVWLEIVKAIAILRPSLVVIENVRGLLTARGDDPTAEHVAAEATRDAATSLLAWLATEHDIALTKGDDRRARECATRTIRVMGLRRRAVARCQWHERRLVRAVGTVLGSLADLGFDAEGVLVGADEAGACHARKRVFILAWLASDARSERRHGWSGVSRDRRAASIREQARDHRGDSAGPPAADADRAAGDQWRLPAPGQAEGGRSYSDAGGRGGTHALADTGRAGLEIRAVESDRHERSAAERSGGDAAAHAERDGLQGQRVDAGPGAGRPAAATGGRGPARGGRTLADAQGDGWDEGWPEPAGIIRGSDAPLGGHGPAAHAASIGHRDTGTQVERRIPAAAVSGSPADSDRGRLAELAERDGGTLAGFDGTLRDDAERCGAAPADADCPDAGPDTGGSGGASLAWPGDGPERRSEPGSGISGDAPADADGSGRGAEPGFERGLRSAEHEPGDIAWGAYELAIRRWERAIRRPAPRPTEPGRTGERLSPRFVEWMMGLPEGWVTDVPGLSRNAQLKALGNGVVPQQAAMALRMLLDRADIPSLAAAGEVA